MECPCAVLAYCALLDVLCRDFVVAGLAAADAAQPRKNRVEGRHAARRCQCHQAAVLARRARPVAPAGWPHGRGGGQRQEHSRRHGGPVATAAGGGRTGGRVRVRLSQAPSSPFPAHSRRSLPFTGSPVPARKPPPRRIRQQRWRGQAAGRRRRRLLPPRHRDHRSGRATRRRSRPHRTVRLHCPLHPCRP